LAEKRRARHAEIAGGVGGRHEALIPENPMDPVPGETGPDRLLREVLVERFRRVAPGERDDGAAVIAGRKIAEIVRPGAGQIGSILTDPKRSKCRFHALCLVSPLGSKDKGKKLPLVVPAKTRIQ